MTSATSIDEMFRPTQVRCKIVLRADLAAEAESLEQTLRGLPDDGSVAGGNLALAQQILDLKAEVAASEVEFAFAALGRKAYTDLVAANPATAAQNAELGDGDSLIFNPETFPPALLAASCISPTGTSREWWAEKYEQWPEGVMQRLWQTCTVAHNAVAEVPKALIASAAVNGSGKN